MITRRTMYMMLSIGVLLSPIFCLNAQITMEPQYDMYTDPDHTGAHPAAELWVANYDPAGNHQRIMIMFDLSSYMGGTVDSAFLNLDRFFGCPSGDPTHTKIYAITEPWNESWPENVHISHDTLEWASYTFSSNGWHRINITSLVNAWLSGTVTNYGLVIQALPDNKFSKFYSREASPSVRPYLELFGYSSVGEENNAREISCIIKAVPNPFYSTCQINVPEGSTVEIFRTDGRKIYRIKSSRSVLIWEPPESIGSGVYFIHAIHGEQTAIKKILYFKK